MTMRAVVLLASLFASSSTVAFTVAPVGTRIFSRSAGAPPLYSTTDESGAPSDYDSEDLQDGKTVAVDDNEEDAAIRDALKRELLLLSSVTNRGEYASPDEQNVLTDLVAQLEALNPTADPARNSQGEWDLCLSSTQFFRSSPFFMTIRAAMGDDNKAVAENFFDIHDRATTASRMGRVRQTITPEQLTSEVDIELGLVPGLPFRVKGTVVTTASQSIKSSETTELQIQGTLVKGSNIPLFNQFLDDVKMELPFGDLLKQIQGSVPIVQLKTFYLDEGLRITRDIDDNFFVYTRA
jgi:PAP_fibrillin